MSGNHANNPEQPALKLTHLSLENAAKILSTAMERIVPVGVIQAHVDAGAPQNADGTLNLVEYAAWLVREVSHGSD